MHRTGYLRRALGCLRPRGSWQDEGELLSHFIDKALSSHKKSDPFWGILKVLADLVSASGATLLLANEGRTEYLLKKAYHTHPFCCSVGFDFGLCHFLRSHPRVLARAMLLKERFCEEVRAPGLKYLNEFQCEVVIPLMRGGDLIGLVNLGRKSRGDYSASECRMLGILGNLIANEVQNVNLLTVLQQQNDRLQELDILKNQILANVTHELRTPLNGILGLTEAMLDGTDGAISEDQKRHLGMVHGAGQNLLEMVNNILDLSKLESQQMALNIARVDLTRLASEACQLFEGVMRSRGITLACEMAPVLASIFVDGDRIRQVLMNVIGNAIKFTRQGAIVVSGHKHGDMAKICVRDTGIGVREADRELIFEAFQQADGTNNREFSGTGLGLALSKRIVELHGGRIWHEANGDRGSCFYFTLPLRPGFARPARQGSQTQGMGTSFYSLPASQHDFAGHP